MTNKNDDLVAVTEFICASRQNLEIASAVFEQYEAAKAQIISGFFSRLANRLMNKLPGWSWEYAPAFFTERYGRFGIWKNPWKGRYRIVIEAYDWGARTIGGVWRDENTLGSAPRDPNLLAAVKQLHPGDRCVGRTWFEAEVTLRSPAADWRTPEILWRIHSDERFLGEIANLFLDWVKASEKMVDAAVARLAN